MCCNVKWQYCLGSPRLVTNEDIRVCVPLSCGRKAKTEVLLSSSVRIGTAGCWWRCCRSDLSFGSVGGDGEYCNEITLSSLKLISQWTGGIISKIILCIANPSNHDLTAFQNTSMNSIRNHPSFFFRNYSKNHQKLFQEFPNKFPQDFFRKSFRMFFRNYIRIFSSISSG